MSHRVFNLPNFITVSRIALCPVLLWLVMSSDTRLRFAGFALFTLAGLSDILDGYIARRDDLVTDLGKLLDPIADKLLLAVTLIPIYLISQRGGPLDELPWIGPLPLWVLFVIFGRELLITIFRAYAARQGVVIAAGWSGKRKAMFQMFFTGAVLLWYPLVDVGLAKGWDNWLWDLGSMGLQAWVPIMLGFALLLTVYSLIDYLWSYRVVVGIRD
ncbi:MAG TPA: CDP-diacylglycerol--glycerol-3-phosphate 3-phosphatidyltransferase [Gemmatimonadetes bacterium]|nr:CDP-diacylglycerol--glycerol-3-phosphate 3-phosphatidyltransferase [Gemmatimonadota bacterium]HCO12782.1 CDP-diacylglycerol--glycerol-3-phosphate 3-phosphatidyltransferase [Gemmatimonadota bacterium]